MQVIENIIYQYNRITPEIFAIHAGAVSIDSKAYLFVASTTSGKTTLTAYLTQRGYEYVSDDCVYIDMTTMNVYPCHLAIHLRQGGYDILMKYNMLQDNVKYIDETSIERYVYTPKSLSPQIMEIGRIFFIERTDDKNEIAKIDKSDCIKKLMVSPIKPYKLSGGYISFLNALSDKCERLKYCDMEYVSSHIRGIR